MGCHSVVEHLLAWHAYNLNTHIHAKNSINNNYGKHGIFLIKYTFIKKNTWHKWRKRLTCMEENHTSRLFKNV